MTEGWDWDEVQAQREPRPPVRPPTPPATRYLRIIAGILTAALIIGWIAYFRHSASQQQIRACMSTADVMDPNSSDTTTSDYLAWCKSQ